MVDLSATNIIGALHLGLFYGALSATNIIGALHLGLLYGALSATNDPS